MSDQETINRLYASTLRIRVIEEYLASIYHLREMRTPTHFSLGREAIAAGVCAALKKEDQVYSTYRCHGWYLAKGGPLDGMVGELFGKVNGCCRGFAGSMHLIDLEVGFAGTTALVGAAIPHAVGAAFSAAYRKSNFVTVSVLGDAATEEGVFTESAMFSALRKLPIVYICENDRLAVNSHLKDRQPPVPIHERVKGLGLPTVSADGNDAVEVYEATLEAVERARKGGGPTFLEFETWRPIEHCGPNPDFQLGYRSADEIREWADRDPLVVLEKRIDSKLREELRRKFKEEVEASVARARLAPFPATLDPERV